jgi:hypothetical protein
MGTVNNNMARVMQKFADGATEFHFDASFTAPNAYRDMFYRHMRRETIKFDERSNRTTTEFTIHVRTRGQAATYVEFMDNFLDVLSMSLTEEVLAERQEIISANKLRKLTFRKPIRLPYEGQSERQIRRFIRLSL